MPSPFPYPCETVKLLLTQCKTHKKYLNKKTEDKILDKWGKHNEGKTTKYTKCHVIPHL